MVTVKTFQDLEDTSHDLGDLQIYFEKSRTRWPIVRGGSEGYAAPVRVRHRASSDRGEPHMLKVYLNPVAERRERAAFLSALGLPSLPLRIKLFEAAPTRPVSHTIIIPKSRESVAVEGYLAPFIAGVTFGELLVDGWKADIAARISVARQLCLAVEVLEEGGKLVHGDLSPGNLLILGAETPSPEIRLVDFDGFHHPDIPPVPTGKGGRSWGTPGYCAPALKKRDHSVFVSSDRVAMAILVMEIVARRDEDLIDDTLLKQAEIYERRPTLPPEIIARWPEGWELVQRAIAADDPTSAPPPRRWRAALSELLHRGPAILLPSTMGPVSSEPGFVVLVYEHGKERRQVRLPLPQGTFARVSDELGWLAYQQVGDELALTGEPPARIDLTWRRGSWQADPQRCRGEVSVRATKGSVIHWGEFSIYLS
jgi:hypothetical protein